MHTYPERLFVDIATGRPLAGIRATVVDAETEASVQAYRGGVPVALVSNGFGVVDEFQTEDTTRRVRVTVGSRSLSVDCLETLSRAADAVAELERLTTTHVALDPATGRTYYSPGSTDVLLVTDSTGRQYAAPRN